MTVVRDRSRIDSWWVACSSSRSRLRRRSGRHRPGSSATTAAAACGTLPKVAPSDPQGALKTTTATVKGYYNGWPFTLRKSQLANWKPKGKGPYTVGVLFDGLSNPFQAYVFNSLQKFLKRSAAVDKVIAVVSEAGNPTKEGPELPVARPAGRRPDHRPALVGAGDAPGRQGRSQAGCRDDRVHQPARPTRRR